MTSKANKEPSTAPPVEQWFPLSLGSSIRDASPSTRFYSLRYEFKPASIDTTRPGTLHKSVDNKVTVEFSNNQAGKPKVSFQGNSEDCKELDAVVFFDGQSFRLERLHRAVKSLRHMRLPGESSTAANVNNSVGASGGASAMETTTPPSQQNGSIVPAANVNIEKISPLVQVEEITIGQTETKVCEKKTNKRKADAPLAKTSKGRTPPRQPTPVEDKSNDVQVDVDGDIDERETAFKVEETPLQQPEAKVDEEVVSDYEIEDVDVSEDDEGLNAAEALRAQAAVDGHKEDSSSGSSASGSGSSSSSESGSGSSSSSESGSDDEDSASSADDI